MLISVGESVFEITMRRCEFRYQVVKHTSCRTLHDLLDDATAQIPACGERARAHGGRTHA
jgi:hypothetical protein